MHLLPTNYEPDKWATQYPDVRVDLVPFRGNVLGTVGAVCRGLRDAGVPDVVREEFLVEAIDLKYDELLVVVSQWVTPVWVHSMFASLDENRDH